MKASASPQKMGRVAFTLAEVLITLGIIGVVAAMTMPTLINKYQEKVTVSKLKKVYSMLSQGYLFSVQEYGEPEGWGISGRDAGSSDEDEETYNAANAILVRNRLFKDLKKVQNCDNAKNQTACDVPEKVYYADGGQDSAMNSQTASSIMADGTTFLVISNGADLKYRGPGALSKTYARIIVDLNGKKSPNTYGKDIFVFYLTNTNIMPEGTEKETHWSFTKCNSKGLGCTAWVIYNENMDYLHCNDLSWNGKKKCN